jgi:membrane protein DedA with SNARE-associated domain
MLVLGFSIFDVASHVGLPLIFLIVVIETGCGIPVAPGEIAVVSGGIEASQHQLNLVAVMAVAATAAIVGDNIGYMIGRQGGRRLLEAPGPFRRQRRRAVELGDPFFARHGAKAVFYGRWLPFLRVFASWFAGATKMPWRKFAAWNAAGGILWAITIALLGYTLGATAKTVVNDIGVYGLILMALGITVAYVLHRRHQRKVLGEIAPEAAVPSPGEPTVGSTVVAPTDQRTVLSPRPQADQATVGTPRPATPNQPPTSPPAT